MTGRFEARTASQTAGRTSEPSVSVVIPTLDEAERLPALLTDLRGLEVSSEVIVVDGGSTDATVALARSAGARVVHAGQGRGRQMNAGARAARYPWLCFLHADVRLSLPARTDLVGALVDPFTDAAVWRLAIDAGHWWFRVVEWGARARDRLGGLPYGDQGLLVRTRLFDRLGGFPEIPVMEDVALVRAVGRHATLRRFSSSISVSDRRWQAEGRFRTLARNSALVAAYLSGVAPQRLAKWYPAHSP